MKCCVYKILNNLNDKIYIGKTSNLEQRWKNHIKVARGGKEKYPIHFQAIHAAIKKYGESNFTLSVIKEFDSESESFQEETQIISMMRQSGVKLYNLTDGGEGLLGYKHTESAKNKISDYLRTRQLTEQNKLNMSKAQIESWKTRSRTTKPCPEEVKTKISAANKGSNNGSSKLTESDVIVIKQLLKDTKILHKEIAKTFNVSRVLITGIKSGRFWSHIQV